MAKPPDMRLALQAAVRGRHDTSGEHPRCDNFTNGSHPNLGHTTNACLWFDCSYHIKDVIGYKLMQTCC